MSLWPEHQKSSELENVKLVGNISDRSKGQDISIFCLLSWRPQERYTRWSKLQLSLLVINLWEFLKKMRSIMGLLLHAVPHGERGVWTFGWSFSLVQWKEPVKGGGDICVKYPLDAFLWRHSRHVQRGDPEADPRHAGGIICPIWPGKDLGGSSKVGRGMGYFL